ncbi:MAG: FxDxF family PEP-CTERM protein [Pseudomonadota bacterium]|nr:FxDxF family PEP-CTERM protein [Pseudomonadota bacterium]
MNKLNISKTLARSSIAAAALLVFASNASAVSLVALTSSNQIGIFDSSSASVDISTFNAITGTAPGEYFVGIDLRPSDNMIYGISTDNKIYTVDPSTGVSSFVVDLSNSIVDSNKSYGLDINPVADRTPNASIRLVSSTGDNYGINATTGAVTVATSIDAGFTAVSYSNSDASTPNVAPASTELYYVNSTTDSLAFAPSAFNNPTISEVGSLGVDVLNASGFEITSTDSAFAALNFDSNALRTGLFTVDLDTGAATQTGLFIGTINGLTAAPIPEPETYAMFLAGLGLMGFVARRRKV